MLSRHRTRKKLSLGLMSGIWKISKTNDFYMHTCERWSEIHSRQRRSSTFHARAKAQKCERISWVWKEGNSACVVIGMLAERQTEWGGVPGCKRSFRHLIISVRKSFRDSSVGKESACNVEDLGSIPGLGRSLEKASILAWRMPWTV